MTLPNDDVARAVTARTMLTKGMYEIWGEGATWEVGSCDHTHHFCLCLAAHGLCVPPCKPLMPYRPVAHTHAAPYSVSSSSTGAACQAVVCGPSSPSPFMLLHAPPSSLILLLLILPKSWHTPTRSPTILITCLRLPFLCFTNRAMITQLRSPGAGGVHPVVPRGPQGALARA